MADKETVQIEVTVEELLTICDGLTTEAAELRKYDESRPLLRRWRQTRSEIIEELEERLLSTLRETV